ncbi:MAG: type IX secretion system membrane protein PorP/SprF [Lewinella sp.]|nr:type IX secretion system membrane protein PorP/SprF [Lewinella sp.]
MILRRLLLAFCCLFTTLALGAQDIHYTLHNFAPLWLNPALTGAFNGTFRVGGIYRGQWHGTSGINSPNLFVDAPLIKGLRKQDWIGVGFNLVTDNSGPDNIKTTISNISGAYHFALDPKQRSVVTLGLQYGSVSFGFEPRTNFTDQNTISGSLGGRGQNMSENLLGGMGGGGGGGGGGNRNNNGPRTNYTDINAGLTFRTTLNTEKANKAGSWLRHASLKL